MRSEVSLVRGRKQEVEQLQKRLAEARKQIAALNDELRSLQTSDPITGLPLLGVLLQRLGTEIERSKRHGRPLTVAVVDIDHFRAINSHHGRKVGDEVLAAVGRTLTASTPATDLLCRSGSDEYVVMMPETTATDAVHALERLFVELEALHVADIESVPVSIGVAQWERGLSADQLIGAAGARVDVARSLGGGRLTLADPTTEKGDPEDPDSKGDVITALAEALSQRDRYTGEHSESVLDLVEAVARGLALDAREVKNIKAAALLHDIGKVAIPDEVLNKTGPLDEDEWAIMREHPVTGERILRAIPGMGPIARIVRHEHESFDGSGYPDGLAGDDIPIGARIILACDAYHAMTSDRPYRKAMTHGEAIGELANGAGKQFDPRVTEQLIGTLYGRRQSGAGRTDAENADATR